MNLLGASNDAARRSIVTPEGVQLTMHVGDMGRRLAAFWIDFLIISAIVALVALLWRSMAGGHWQVDPHPYVAGSYLVRMLYFTYFELKWRGQTPGKRRMGLRVTDRTGGPLMPQAVWVRHLLREIEFLLPFSLIALSLSPAFDLVSPFEAQRNVFAAIWMFALGAVPFFQRDRLRIGDLAAGTWVIEDVREKLNVDLAGEAGGGEFVFSEAQLAIYGIFELQVLEKVLRDEAEEVLRGIAERVCRKIGWNGRSVTDPHRFLLDFYKAQRRHLEANVLMGKGKRDKHG